jgi:hypothetical protein
MRETGAGKSEAQTEEEYKRSLELDHQTSIHNDNEIHRTHARAPQSNTTNPKHNATRPATSIVYSREGGNEPGYPAKN